MKNPGLYSEPRICSSFSLPNFSISRSFLSDLIRFVCFAPVFSVYLSLFSYPSSLEPIISQRPLSCPVSFYLISSHLSGFPRFFLPVLMHSVNCCISHYQSNGRCQPGFFIFFIISFGAHCIMLDTRVLHILLRITREISKIRNSNENFGKTLSYAWIVFHLAEYKGVLQTHYSQIVRKSSV